MCLLMLLGGAILLLVTLFMSSAILVLPWTAISTISAGLIAFQLGTRLGRTPRTRATVGVVATIVLTFAFGYLGYSWIQPVVPPPKTGLAVLLEAPVPTADYLRKMFPIHLAIWAVLGAKVVGGWCYFHEHVSNAVAEESGEDETITPDELSNA